MNYQIPVTWYDMLELHVRRMFCWLIHRHRPANWTVWKCRCMIWWNYGSCGGRNSYKES